MHGMNSKPYLVLLLYGAVFIPKVQKTSRQISSKFPCSYSVMFSQKIKIIILSAMGNLILHFYGNNKKWKRKSLVLSAANLRSSRYSGGSTHSDVYDFFPYMLRKLKVV
jgi:hypothetical protein